MITEPLQETMDRASFELLSQNNPGLIDQIKAALKEGVSAQALERRLLGSHHNRLVVSLAICAAYWLEKNPQEEPNEPTSNPTN